MDLVRHENGIGVADVVDRALLLSPTDMPALEAAYVESDARKAAWREVDEVSGSAPRMVDAMAAVAEALGTSGLTVMEPGTAERLSKTPMFGLGDLLAMVRTDVLDWTWDRGGDISVQRHPGASAVVADAVAAAHCRGMLSVQSYAQLGGPFATVLGRHPSALPVDDSFGPQSVQLRQLVEAVARLSPADVAALEEATREARAEGFHWSQRMHAATWAAHLSGRIRTGARAQLAGARAVLVAGVPPINAASGVMRAVTAAVQALLVADLLDEDNFMQLVAPWERAIGPVG
ncbi:MAG: hypothetical protein JWM93_1952 [Frankiales bacterium]|nr:hypothetical protein [Frankiales bacterium]